MLFVGRWLRGGEVIPYKYICSGAKFLKNKKTIYCLHYVEYD